MIKKHNVNYHLRDLSFFKTFVEFCVKDVYSTIFQEHLQIFCVQITWKCIFRVKNLKVDFFNRVPPDDTPLQIFIMKLLAEESYPFSLPKSYLKVMTGSVICSVKMFDSFMSLELPNSFISFDLYFWVYCKNILRVSIYFVLFGKLSASLSLARYLFD